MRLIVVANLAGALLCLLLAPIQSATWNFPYPLFVIVLWPIVEVGSAIHSAVAAPFGISPYDFWGRFFFLVYLAMLPAALALGPNSRESRVGRLGFRLLVGGLLVALVADVAAYWSHGTALDVLWSAGFGVELLGLLAILVGMTLLGVDESMRGTRLAGMAVIIGALLAVPATFFVGYIPHGPVLPLTIALAVASRQAR
jgi:hypothetical protein